MSGRDWMPRAHCRRLIAAGLADWDDWYPAGRGNHLLDVKLARRRCGGCDVQTECLEYALNRGEVHGIWGGLTPRELRDLTEAAA